MLDGRKAARLPSELCTQSGVGEERPARREEIVSFGAFHEKPGAPGANQLDAAAYVRRDYGNAARHGFENDVR